MRESTSTTAENDKDVVSIDMTSTQQAALLLYREGIETTGRMDGFSRDANQRVSAEAHLRQEVERAQRALTEFREGCGFRTALDSLLPGWFDVDASDHGIPNPDFISSDPVAWVAWLEAQGLEPKAAAELVADHYPELRS